VQVHDEVYWALATAHGVPRTIASCGRCHDAPIRTTVSLNPDLAARLRRLAAERGASFTSTVNATIRAGLEAEHRGGRPYREVTRSLGSQPGIDLTKALALASAIEDDETLRKLEAHR
jgi:hypothetical protein